MSAETGLTEVKPKKVKVQNLVEEVLSKYKSNLDEKDLVVETSIHVDKVKADKSVLDSVLSRLFDNAVKFGSSKQPIEFSADTDGSGHCFFSEKILAQKLWIKKTIAKILQPFSLDENIMNHSAGTGLGLSVCQALLKAHDSQLEIESDRKSFTASFRLPEA